MKIILLKDIRNVGRRYEIKNVSDGFAMNSLIPSKLAEIATPIALKRLESSMKKEDERKKIQNDLLEKNMAGLADITVELTGKANDKGSLFAAIHKNELVTAIKEQTKLDIDEDHIVLEKPLKEIGEHRVKIKSGEKETEIKVNIK